MPSAFPASSLWPDDWPGATFTGRLIDIGANPAGARVTIRPAVPFGLASESGVFVVAEEKDIPLLAGGFTQTIPATGTPGVTPTGWQWMVTITTVDTEQSFLMDAPAGGTVNLTDVVALGVAPPTGLAVTEQMIRDLIRQTVVPGPGVTMQWVDGRLIVSAADGTTVTLTQDPDNALAWVVTGATLSDSTDPYAWQVSGATLTDSATPFAYDIT